MAGEQLAAPAPSPPATPAEHTEDCQLRQRVLDAAAPDAKAQLRAHYRKDPAWTTCTCWCHVPPPPPPPRGRRR